MQTFQVAGSESKVQELVGLLEKSVAAYGEAGKGGAESRLYSYMNYIEEEIFHKMPKEEAIAASCEAWNSVAVESCDAQEVAESVRLHNPRLPGNVCSELARRILAFNIARAEARPTYDAVLAFLGLEWAFDEDDRQPGSCPDPMDDEFLDDCTPDDITQVIAGYEEPLSDVDMSIGMGPATAEEARKLIALAQTVNAARAEWRSRARQVAVDYGS